MTAIFEANHDSSSVLTDHYDSVGNSESAMSITLAARLDLSTRGVDMDYDTGTGSGTYFLSEALIWTTDDFRFRFRIKLDGLTNNNAGVVILTIKLEDTGNHDVFIVKVNANSGDSGYNVTAFFLESSGKGGGEIQIGSGSDAISSTGEVCIELRAIRETASPGSDGEAQLYINGSSVQSISNAENRDFFATIDTTTIEFDPTDSDITGNMFYDQFLLDDDNTLSTMCAAATDIYALVLGGGQT